jgi:hypothetical protein
MYLPRRISKWTPVIGVINRSVTGGSGVYGAADGEVGVGWRVSYGRPATVMGLDS